jgi:hypothetical protein
MNLVDQEIYVVHSKMFWNYTSRKWYFVTWCYWERISKWFGEQYMFYGGVTQLGINVWHLRNVIEVYLLLQLPPALARWILVHTEDMNWDTWTCQLYFSGQGEFLQWTATCVTLSTNISLQHTNKLFSYYTREVNKDIVYSATLFWGCYRANEGLCISPRAVTCHIFQ